MSDNEETNKKSKDELESAKGNKAAGKSGSTKKENETASKASAEKESKAVAEDSSVVKGADEKAAKEDKKESADEEPKKEDKKESADEEPAEEKKKGKGLKVLLIIVIILVVLVGGGGIAYSTLHDTPGFCNFLCHVPMDPYVASYNENISKNPLQLDYADTNKLSVTVHKESDQEITCLGCHEPTMSEQIAEGLKWVTGDYDVPLQMRLIYKQPAEGTNDKNGMDFCLREGCHEGITTIEELKVANADLARNPHDNHNGNQNCYICHKTHELSVMPCTQCHLDATVPDGWLTYNEWNDLINSAQQ